MTGRWDVPALRAGGSVALVFAVPLSIAARVLTDRAEDNGDTSGLASLLALAALLAFVLGAAVAAWHQDRRTPLSHGIVAAGGAFVIGQAALLIVRVISGGDIRWLAIAINLTLTLVAGTVGGFVGSLMRRAGLTPTQRR
jgi:asparagine N-glycosylation enzyme membrane subunit Stt3